jgi:predicted DNA-binding transcriptional regulator YafY
MARATVPQKAERLNLAWRLLRRDAQVLEAADALVRRCGVSKRQAYRYLQLAQRMDGPVPVGGAKVAFTVKLSRTLVQRLRRYAAATGLTLSEIVSRAVGALVNRGGGRV